MRYDEATVGVITLSKLGLDQFDDDDLRLLTILADQAATAIESARLLARSQDLAGELRRLLDMSAELSREPGPAPGRGPDGVPPRRGPWASRSARSATGTARWAGSIRSATTRRSEPGSWSRTSTSPATRRHCASWSRRQTVIIDAEDPAADPAEVELLVEAGNRMVAMLPLVAKGQAIGLVELFSQVGVPLGRRPAGARPDDGQRGGDGARERPPLRGRPQARRPRPADRLLQPPVPARAPRRGGHPRPARPAAA